MIAPTTGVEMLRPVGRRPGLRGAAERALAPQRRLPADVATFTARGFAPSAATTRAGPKSIGRTFIGGYNAALESTRLDSLAGRLDGIDLGGPGFALERAAMAPVGARRALARLRRRWPGAGERGSRAGGG